MTIDKNLMYPYDVVLKFEECNKLDEHDIKYLISETTDIYNAYIALIWENRMLQTIVDKK